ncbi:MAG TPA: hypothetical protein DDW76_28065 [Cyanobacteria bacterium UBA11369]|nr:hypothetical protein [Cyanobacteria bacterium UBA11371]HBE36194.1 hypothetical protein [Cyanobacteria bacterium UBA11368]HBE52522.1 hypothetical protein [Cyanobacteria bacterium UBA11369]
MLTLLSNICLWLYSILLLAYPPAFRWEYGEEMTQLFRDMLQDSIRQRGCWGILEVWFCVLPDWVSTVRQQRLLAGSYYRARWIFARVVQAAIALIFLAFGFVYWFYVR